MLLSLCAPWKPCLEAIGEEQLAAPQGTVHWQRGMRRAKVGCSGVANEPTRGVHGKCIAVSRAATAHKVYAANPSPEGLHAANGVAPKIAMHARS